ncbi:MAG: CHASE2 domain-containing protein [Deltaproteobacteria bacterium]|nr:CHASE2 domain-containing protein [Deltaproteobacteria bacterium]
MSKILKKIFKLSALRLSMLLALIIFILVFFKEVNHWDWGFFDAMEAKAIDLMFKARGKEPDHGQVAIVAIDEKSIEQLGKWPWPRHVQAQLLESIYKLGAKVVGFDIVWSDLDPTSTALGSILSKDFEELDLAPVDHVAGSLLAGLQEAGQAMHRAVALLSGIASSGEKDTATTARNVLKSLEQANGAFRTFLSKSQNLLQKLDTYYKERLKFEVGAPRLFARFDEETGIPAGGVKALLMEPLVQAGAIISTVEKKIEKLPDSVREAIGQVEAGRRKVTMAVDDLQRRVELFRAGIKRESKKLYEEGTPGDKALSHVLGEYSDSTVLGYFMFKSREEIRDIEQKRLDESLERIKTSRIAAIQYPKGVSEVKAWWSDPFVKYLGVQAPLKIFSDAAEHFGFFNFEPDEDGGLRWATLVAEVRRGKETVQDHQRKLFPSLALKCAALYLDVASLAVVRGPEGIQEVKVGRVSIPTNRYGRMLINYHGPGRTFPHYSAVDVLTGEVGKEVLKDKVILVGATATGIYDLRNTPFDATFPGVEVHANIIDNILNQDFIVRPFWAVPMELAFILGFGLLLGVVLGRIKAAWGAGLLVMLILAYYFFDKDMLFEKGYLAKVVLPIMELLMIFFGVYIYRYMTEEREKKKVRKAFAHYLHEDVIEQLLADQSRLRLGGERLELTVLFSDIRGFTSISEGLSAEQLVDVLNRYLTPMTEIVFEYKGLLDKYIGDAIMAVFGAPIHYPGHAENACRAACNMLKRLSLLQEEFKKEGLPRIDIGVGINTGIVSVGNMGSTQRFDYTVMGDNVNLASRLEGINKQYKTRIIISQYTKKAIGDDFTTRLMDIVRVKGKKEPVEIFELRADRPPSEKDLEFIRTFEEGIGLYRKKEWDKAIARFEKTLEMEPEDYPSNLWISRCKEFRESPPGDAWDGVFTMTTK